MYNRFDYLKIAKERGNSYRKNEEISGWKTNKHTEASLKHLDDHRCFSRSEESKYVWTHGKDGATWVGDKTGFSVIDLV